MSGAAADQDDGLVSGHLEPLHQAECHEMPHVEGVGGWVKADIKPGIAIVDELPDFRFIRHLGDQTSGLQFFINLHVLHPF